MRADDTKLFDTSAIPDDSKYWDALGDRISTRAALAGTDSFTWLAQPRTAYSLACALAIGLALSVWWPVNSMDVRSDLSEWTEALAPMDDMGRAVLIRDDPPPVGELLLGAGKGASQ